MLFGKAARSGERREWLKAGSFTLLEKHRAFNANSACLSGGTESFTERHELLDDLLSIFSNNETKIINISDKEKNKKKYKREEDERNGVAPRDTAMASLGKREARPIVGDRAEKKSKYDSMMEQIVEDTKSKNEIQRVTGRFSLQDRMLITFTKWSLGFFEANGYFDSLLAVHFPSIGHPGHHSLGDLALAHTLR